MLPDVYDSQQKASQNNSPRKMNLRAKKAHEDDGKYDCKYYSDC